MKNARTVILLLLVAAASAAVTHIVTTRQAASPQPRSPEAAPRADSSDIARLQAEVAELRRLLDETRRPQASTPASPPPSPAASASLAGTQAEPARDAQVAILADFDRAMDSEFSRLENRLQQSGDDGEQAIITNLLGHLHALDAVWIRVDAAADEAGRARGRAEAQDIMGQIITLAATHRNYRLSQFARRLGIEKDEDVVAFLNELDQAYRDTHTDWSRLFNRGN